MPEFETDADRTYIITTIRQREGFEVENQNFAQKNERSLSEVLSIRNYNKVHSIISFIEKNGKITPKEAEMLTGKSAAMVRRYFNLLVDFGYIVAEGNTNNIVYCRSGL